MRLKAVLNNNIATCYCRLKQYERADLYNNSALMEDPDYPKALQRKCEILFESGEYTHCSQMCEWAVQKFSGKDEKEETQALIPSLKELKDKAETEKPNEDKKKAEIAAQQDDDEDDEFDEIFEDDDIKELIQKIIKETNLDKFETEENKKSDPQEGH